MAVTTNATLLVRRGLEADFRPDKMKQGEWALSTDNKYIRMCVADGVCVRIATYDAFEEDMQIIEGIIAEARDIKTALEQIQTVVSGKADQVEVWAENAEIYAGQAEASATQSESWAVGGTGSREGEDTDNAKYWAEEAQKAAKGGGTTDYTQLNNKPKINNVELTGNKTTADLGIVIPTALSDLSEDDAHKTVSKTEKEYWSAKSDFDGSYNSLTDKPSIPSALADLTDDATHRTVTDAEKAKWNQGGGGGGTSDYLELSNKPKINGVTLAGDKSAEDLGLAQYHAASTDFMGLVKIPTDGSIGIAEDGTIHTTATNNYNYLLNKPQINGVVLDGNKALKTFGIATSLSELEDDATHRTVTDYEKSVWNAKSDFDGSYNSLEDKPNIPKALVDLTDDATHRTVTDAEKEAWNNAGGAETWTELSGKPFESLGENLSVEDGILSSQSAEIDQKTAILTASGWSDKQQIITDADVTTNALVLIDYGGKSGITCEQLDGSLKFTATETPTEDITLKIGVIKGNGTASDNLIKTKTINLGSISGWSSNYKGYTWKSQGIDVTKEEVLSVGIINFTGNCVLTALIGTTEFYILTTSTSVTPTNVQLLVTYRNR